MTYWLVGEEPSHNRNRTTISGEKVTATAPVARDTPALNCTISSSVGQSEKQLSSQMMQSTELDHGIESSTTWYGINYILY